MERRWGEFLPSRKFTALWGDKLQPQSIQARGKVLRMPGGGAVHSPSQEHRPFPLPLPLSLLSSEGPSFASVTCFLSLRSPAGSFILPL